jgi:diguanylate cyclase (GGDEF)-like protein/PAS domain S-box-containing protein
MITKKLLQAALAATSEAIIIAEVGIEDKKSIIYANKAFEKLTGYSEAEIIGRDYHKVQTMIELEAEIIDMRKNISRAEYNGENFRITLSNYTKAGKHFWSELSISPLCNNKGIATHFIIVMHDVSERIEYQEKIENQNKVLVMDNQKLEVLATHDPLTNLFNRRFFDKELARLCAFNQRYNIPLCIAFLDVDFFKNYNDCYGHAEGDKTLRLIADEIGRHFGRETDIAARFGGEEFVVMTVGDDKRGVFQQHIEELRQSIEDLAIPHQKSQVANVITVSAGVYVSTPVSGAIPTHFIEKADQAMYLAKRRGRNRVEVATDRLEEDELNAARN